MRRSRISKSALAACIVCVLAMTPLLAIAATGQGMPVVGTYTGMVGGQSQDKKASKGVTVFVEQEGAKAKVSFLVSGFPNVFVLFLPALLAEFHASRATTALPMSFMWLGGAALGPVAGWLVARRSASQRSQARVWRVLPRPMSSARTPPKLFSERNARK